MDDEYREAVENLRRAKLSLENAEANMRTARRCLRDYEEYSQTLDDESYQDEYDYARLRFLKAILHEELLRNVVIQTFIKMNQPKSG